MLITRVIPIEMSINLGLAADQIEKAALDYKLVPGATYNVDTDYFKVNAAAASLLASYLMINSQSEGGFSVSFNTDEIKNRINFLAKNSNGLFIVPVELQVKDRRVRAINRW